MLQEISKGLYVFKEPSFDSSRPLAVGVHPFFHKPHFAPEGHKDHDYLKGVERLVTKHEGPVLLLEERTNLENTANHVLSYGRTGDLYFACTGEIYPSFIEMGWKSLFGIIDDISNRQVRLFGGLYDPKMTEATRANYSSCVSETEGLNELLKRPINKAATHTGCLGYFEAVLRCYDKHDIKVIEELTFT